MNITGRTKIFVNNDKGFPIYKAGVSNKDKDGTYHNAYMEIKFKRGLKEPADKTVIEIKNAFLSFREWSKDDKTYKVFYIMCTDYDVIEAGTPMFTEIPEEELSDLPF